MNSLRTSTVLTAGLLAAATALYGQPVIEFSPAAYTTGENAGSVTLTVQRSGETAAVAAVDYTTADKTAVAGVKYTAASGILTFAAGETRRTITVPLLNDGLAGGSSSFQVLLSNPSGGALLGPDSTATVTLVDPDQGISFRFATYSVAEDAGAVQIGIVRGDDWDQPITVELATADDTARAGLDYTALNQRVELPGERRLSFVSVPILNNQRKDGNRKFNVTLSNPAGGALGCTPMTTVTILDNDEGFEFESAGYTVAEDSAAAVIPVRRGSDEAGSTVTVDFATSDGTARAGADYVATTGTLTFVSGGEAKPVVVPILNDGFLESTKTFMLRLSNPTGGAVLGARTNTAVSIQDNDPGPGFERASCSVWAGAGALTVTIVRGGDGAPGLFSIDYATADGTAKAGQDYEATSGSITFQENETIKGVTIPIFRAAGAASTRTFSLKLSNPTGGIKLGRTSATVRIEKNDVTVTPPFASALAARVDQGACVLTWTGGGTLQRADRVTGPWETLSSAQSPHRVITRSPATFYRVTHPRPALVYVPSSYEADTPMPLVLLLHGLNHSGQGVEDTLRLRPLAEDRGFLYCYPDGSRNSFGYPGWNADDYDGDPASDLGTAITDDAVYLRDLIEEIARRFAVDRRRIYLIGASAGGAMAYRMACQFSHLVAGIASHAGFSFFDSPSCIPTDRVNVLRLQSLDDDYWGGPGRWTLCSGIGFYVNNTPAPSVASNVREWAGYNGAAEPTTDTDPTMDLILDVPGLDTIVTRYPEHPPGGAVELWTLTGGPHRPQFGPEYAPRVVDWLLAHPKP